MSEFYRNYLAVAVFIGAALVMVGAMLGVGRLLRPNRPQAQKLIPYEAGSDPVLGQDVRQRVGAAVELGVGQPSGRRDDDLALRRSIDDPFEQVGEIEPGHASGPLRD